LAIITALAPQPAGAQPPADNAGRVWLGVSIRDPDGEPGPVVTAVDAGGPAATAGVSRGDVVLRVDGAPVADRAQFIERVRAHQPGDAVRLRVATAGGAERDLVVALSARASETDRLMERLQDTLANGAFWAGRPRLGIDVVDMDADLARYFNAPSADAPLVTRVHPDGPAAAVGIQAGDVIVTFAGHPAHGVAGLQTQIAEQTEPGKVPIVVWRRDRRLTFDVQLDASPRLRRTSRPDATPIAELEELRRELRNLSREVDDLRREVDLLRRRR
jgi:S1-C subfamily serine protease